MGVLESDENPGNLFVWYFFPENKKEHLDDVQPVLIFYLSQDFTVPGWILQKLNVDVIILKVSIPSEIKSFQTLNVQDKGRQVWKQISMDLWIYVWEPIQNLKNLINSILSHRFSWVNELMVHKVGKFLCSFRVRWKIILSH